MRLKDKIILVTGATSGGIGEGMVRVFAREGARVIVHGMRMADAEETAAEIAASGGIAHAVAGDLQDTEAPPRIIGEGVAKWGRLDALVNNAATTARGSLDNTDAAEFNRVIAINLRAPFLLIKAAIPHFRKQGGGRVINIGSVNAYCGEKNLFAYSISKGGLATLTRNLADAYGAEGLRIQQFNVGWTLTKAEYEIKLKDGMPEDWYKNMPKEYAPSGRLLSPEDVAWAAVYFLSDEAPLVNGAILDFEQYPVVGRNPHKQL